MSKMLCLCCGEIYNKEDFKEYPYCPKVSCVSDINLVEIDENMIYPIKILNEKGWITRFCCAGHLYESCISAYISFKEEFCPKVEPPKYWYWDDSTLRTTDVIKSYFNLVDKQKYLFKFIQSLLKWCEELPYNPEIY